MELCQNVGVRLEFLPPYSPDFNLIEEAFTELKAWMRKNTALASSFDDFEDFLQAGMAFMSNKPGKHFRSCHIEI